MKSQSVAERIAELPVAERNAALKAFSDKELAELLYDWRGFLARPDQVAPDGDWSIWLVLAGRGWGKTEVGAQWIKEQIAAGVKSIALVAETQKDLEEVMVKRLLDIYPPGEGPRVRYKPVRLSWPCGAEALGYNGTEPEQLRGPEFEVAWVDEIAKYRHSRETWDMLQFCMRKGHHPRQIITTTPRPIELVKSLVSGNEGKIIVTRGSTMDNRSNLAAPFIEKIQARYAGTRLGRQELNGEVLGDMPGALWQQGAIDLYRVRDMPKLERIVVAVDPAVTDTETSDEHGIIAAGVGADQRGYIIDDASTTGSPVEWARRTISTFDRLQADAIVIEINQGGDMVRHVLDSIRPNLPIIEVRATRGKHVRAEPISALYEQGRISHVGSFSELENQMTMMTSSGYQGEGSPDRLDAAVWALTELFPAMVSEVSEPAQMPRYRTSGAWMG
jgi:phage terminase large subunit-like protein